MENLLVGNGINIQYDKINYTNQNIILRILTELDDKNYPCEYIIDDPLLLKYYIGKLFLFAREMLDGGFDNSTNCTTEKKSLEDFKKRYAPKRKSMRITDIGFEDYYLIHDLVCHKSGTMNPDQYYVRESMRMAYLHSIYNHGKLNLLYTKYSDLFKEFLSKFNNIFSTNYDSNIESATGKKVYHIHGQFDKLSEAYNPESLRNKLPDNPLDGIPNDEEYRYLHSTALSTYCGEYKQYQINQSYTANQVLERMADAYISNEAVHRDVDSWESENNKLVVNMANAIKCKVENPKLRFQEDYYIEEFKSMVGSLTIIGLSPYNDYHIFEIIDNSQVSKCTYYFWDPSECNIIENLLSNLKQTGKLNFKDVKEFWREM